MPGEYNEDSNSNGSSDGASSSLPYPLLLCPGSSFIGYQAGLRSSWTVRVTILDVDMRQLTCCGRMDAVDTPGVDSKLVATYFEGQLLDAQHHTFGSRAEHKQWKSIPPFAQHIYPTLSLTSKANPTHATSTSPLLHHHHVTPTRQNWPSLPPPSSTSSLLPAPALVPSTVTRLLHTSRYMFMRWKEQYYLCGEDGRLSISGVYLLALDRLTGEISGIYWDEQAQTRRGGKKRCQQLRLQRVPDAARDGRISTHGL